MLSASQIAGFLNQVSLQNKSMKQPQFQPECFAWTYSKGGYGQSDFWTLK